MVNQAYPLISTPRLRLKQYGMLPTPSAIPDEKKAKQLKLHQQLSRKDWILFELIQLSPIFVVLSLLYTTHDFLLTLVAFHILLIYLPMLFLKKLKMEKAFAEKIREQQKFDKIKQYGFFFLVIPIIGIVSSYLLFKSLFLQNFISAMRLPKFSDSCYAILLCIDFVLVNPVVEELFWRVFCNLIIEDSTMKGRHISSFHFALYHWFVVYYISQSILISSILAISIFVLGHFFSEIKKRYGILACIIVHIGVDLSAGVALWDMYADFL